MLKNTIRTNTISEGDARDRVILAARNYEEVTYLFTDGNATEEELDSAEQELKEAKKALASCR
jgi:hypothetical protein